MQRRHPLSLLICAAALCTSIASPAALAQSVAWPTKQLRFVAPFPPGGPVDVLARIVGQKITEKSGQPVIIENKAGAAGNIGIEQVAKAPADGTTFLHVPAGNITINATLMKLGYDWDKDFTPVTMIATAPNLLVVNPAVPAKTLKELIAYARANPGKLSFGSPGVGSGLHLSGALFNKEAGLDITHVAYKGTTPAMNDLIGGQITMMFGALPTLMPQVKAGKLRAIAVTSSRRSANAPDIPTMAESGLNIDISSWYAIMAPARTDPEVVKALADEVKRIVALPDVKQSLDAQGLTPVAMPPAELAAYIKKETAVWAKVIRESNIQAE